MTEDVAQDVSQVTDFHFHTCRKFRIFDAKTEKSPENVRNRLATSSQLGVTFAVSSTNKLTCFPTKSLLSFKMTKENMNVEVTDLPVKVINLPGVVEINDIGVNSDGTLLAVLHTNQNDVSADVFDIRTLCSSTGTSPICKTRVGLDVANSGSALEWNPAFPDTFAAASTDKSVLVVKINVQNPSSQTLVGIGKLGGFTTTISWSPKGKQLTIGDSLGKVVQLKPDLEVVRSQFGPEGSGKVTGLCWLATTEWLVAFERAPSEQETFLMRCKKDKPTEWIQFHELSYSSSKWPLRPQLFPATQLLVDWNVVLVGNSRTSEVAVVGKRDDWQTWVPVEGEGIYLPTTADGKDTVPIGISIDRTMTDDVSLKSDGSQKHRPSPLVLNLTNDGVLTAHHVISTFAPHQPCQIPSQNIAISGLMAQKAAPSALPSASPFGSLPTAKPSTIFEQKPKIETTPKIQDASKLNIFGKTAAPAPESILKTPTKPAAAAEPIQKTPEKPAEPEVDKKAEELAAKKKILVEQVAKMNGTLKSSREAIMKMSMSISNAKSSVSECSEVIKSFLTDSKDVVEELKILSSSIEWMAEKTKHTVKEMDFEIEEKMELVADVQDCGEKILEKLRDMSETERLMRFNKLETAADGIHGKFATCQESIQRLRTVLAEKEALRKQSVLSPLRLNSNQLRGHEADIALKVMRNVTKIIMDTRERIQRTELEFVHFQRDLNTLKNTGIHQKSQKSAQNCNISILDTTTLAPELTDSEALKARQSLVSRLQKRGAVKTKNITVETYSRSTEPPKPVEPDTSHLSQAILKLSMTPRRVFTPGTPKSSACQDATTQADEPPVVVVKTVVEPAKPSVVTPTPPKPATGLFGNKGTSVGTSPLANAFAPKPVELPKPATEIVKPVADVLVKPEVPKETSKTPELPKPAAEVQKTPEEPKKAEPVAEKTPEPAKSPVKVPEEQKTPVKQEVNEIPQEKKEEATAAAPVPEVQKTPSFSFNTATTPKAASSIFGGGLNQTASPSGIFGAKTTPPSNTSIFGGGAKPSGASPFGNFGQSAAPTTAAPAAGGGAVTFSFNTAAAQPAKPSFGSFGAAPASKPSVFGSSLTTAPTVPNVDDGMEDDSMPSGGGGFMSGLGSNNSNSSGANPFAPKPSGTTTNSSSWLFSGGGQGAGAAGANQQQKPSFSFNQPSTTTSTSSTFGAAAKFGAQPVFGAKPFGGATGAPSGGGGLSKNSSIFGAAGGAGGGFAQFATGAQKSVFGGGGAAQPAGSSIFGGGANPQAAPTSSIFGGGAQGNQASKSGSFTSWR